MLRGLLFILILPGIVFGQLIDEDVMPFGAYSSHQSDNQTFFSDSCLSVMHNELGINQFTTGFNEYHAGRFADSSIYAYPSGRWNGVSEDQQNLLLCHTSRINPDAIGEGYADNGVAAACSWNGYGCEKEEVRSE